MTTRAEAIAIADAYLRAEIQPFIDEEVVLTRIREFAHAWVVGYNSRSYVETGSARHALAGGGPIIVAKADGSLRLGTSSLPTEQQVEGPEIISSAVNLIDPSA